MASNTKKNGVRRATKFVNKFNFFWNAALALQPPNCYSRTANKKDDSRRRIDNRLRKNRNSKRAGHSIHPLISEPHSTGTVEDCQLRASDPCKVKKMPSIVDDDQTNKCS
jgi:hypothetical protein